MESAEKKTLEIVQNMAANLTAMYGDMHKHYVRKEELQLFNSELTNKLNEIHRDIKDVASSAARLAEEKRQQNGRVGKLEEVKADKWVEKAIIGTVLFVITAVGGAVLSLVLKS